MCRFFAVFERLPAPAPSPRKQDLVLQPIVAQAFLRSRKPNRDLYAFYIIDFK